MSVFDVKVYILHICFVLKADQCMNEMKCSQFCKCKERSFVNRYMVISDNILFKKVFFLLLFILVFLSLHLFFSLFSFNLVMDKITIFLFSFYFYFFFLRLSDDYWLSNYVQCFCFISL